MATSGSTNYSMNHDDVITEALELVGQYSAGEAIPGEDWTSVNRTLQMLLKSWSGEEIGLWKNKEIAVFQSDDGYSYTLGPSGSHASAAYVKTEVATAAASAATAIVIDSTTGMNDNFDIDGIITATTPAAAGTITIDGDLISGIHAVMSSPRKILIYSDADDSGVTFGITGTNSADAVQTENLTGPNTTTVYSTNEYKTITAITIDGAGTGNISVGQVGDFIGIELDDGTIQWTNMGAALSTTTTLIAALTDDVAVDNHIYVYTSKPSRPLEILEARIHHPDDTETPISIISRREYMELSTKTSSSAIANSIYYDPQTNNGILKVWPPCSDTKYWLMLTARMPIEDMDAAGDAPDMPQECFLALSWNLAVLIAPKFGMPLTKSFRDDAKVFKKTVKDFDREQVSSTIEIIT